jgi:UPF0716 protein FxsA
VGKLLLIFTVIPFCELYLLLQVNEVVGFWPTVGLVLLTGVTGAWLARSEGLRVLRRWQKALARGRVPEEGVLGGALLLAGGLLLVTPGLLTDALGLSLLIPVVRLALADRIRQVLEAKVRDGSVQVVRYSDINGIHQSNPHDQPWSPRNVVMDHDPDPTDDDDEETSGSHDRRVLH